MNFLEVLDQVQQNIVGFYKTHTDPRFVYHNLSHTQNVVQATIQIANHYQLDDRDFFIVTTAAWFHDIGYYLDPDLHEQRGAEYAEDFLRKAATDEQLISKVKSCIMSTRIPQNPSSLLEKIVCDADLFHFGTEDFSSINKLMRKEYEAIKNVSVSKDEWRKETTKLLASHHYHTDYCRLLLSDKKQDNIEKLKRKITALEKDSPKSEKVESTAESRQEITNSEPGRNKKEKPERGIETMFRISSTNQQRLSDMADNKANILITVNSIILSAVISLLLRRLEDHIYLVIPTIILLTVSLVTLIYAILATRPFVPAGTFTQNDIDEKRVNLLFFGNFYNMNLDIYASGMEKVMEDKGFLYGTLIRDIHSQGVVLGRKYRLLRVAYNIFMYGLIIAVLAFIIAALVHGED